jgi:hypothetical protein
MESKTIDEILNYLCEELGGEWLITGGSLVRLSFDAQRGTEDLDLVRISHKDLSDDAAKNQLFKWLIARGLGPEWVNSAVEPFVQEISDWKSELVFFKKGAKGIIFRPNLTLFIYLKLRRGTEIDLLDIQKAIPKCPEGFNESKFLKWSNPELNKKFFNVRSRLRL